MKPKLIREKFNELEIRYKKQISEGKDIWPPTLAYFLALKSESRSNHEMYKSYRPALPEKTREEYQQIAKIKIQELKEKMGLT